MKARHCSLCGRLASEPRRECALRAEVERLRAYVARLESELSPAEALAEVERLTKERDEAYDREAKAFDALAKEQIRAGKAGAEVERLRGLIAQVEAGPEWRGERCPWCGASVDAPTHSPDCPAFSARGEVR